MGLLLFYLLTTVLTRAPTLPYLNIFVESGINYKAGGNCPVLQGEVQGARINPMDVSDHTSTQQNKDGACISLWVTSEPDCFLQYTEV